jgi:putative ATP-dependent endonuclease of the OLD family
MKLASLRLQNFRSCRDISVAFDNYTCLVGQNGAGKSTVLTALNVLFRNTSGVATGVTVLSEEDFCNRDTSIPIAIIATFADLSANEAEDFKNYVRHGQLVVTARATWDAERRVAEVKQYGARLVMRAFAPFFEQSKSGAKVSELKTIYDALRGGCATLPSAATKQAMEDALRAHEEAHPDACELLESEDQFYGYTKGANRLRKYIQWVYIPAVKDAASEQDEAKNSALGELLQRTLRPHVDLAGSLDALRREASEKYAEIVGGHAEALKGASESLQTRLRAWAHPEARVELQWNTDADKAISVQQPVARAKLGDDQFVGDVPRMGHGLQRAFIVAVLQDLAEGGQASSGPTLLLGFEEPELYQHPPQARHLAHVLEELSGQGAQVIVTTHSPYFVSGHGFESIRVMRRGTAGSTATGMTHEQLSERLAQAAGTAAAPPTSMMAALEQVLQPSLNELFFCGVPILVEGTEDVAYIATYMHLSGRWSDFRRYGCHFVTAGGKDSLRRPIAVADGFGGPVFVLFDADANGKPDDMPATHKLNKVLLKLCGVEGVDPCQGGGYFGSNVIAWQNNVGLDAKADVGIEIWNAAEQRVRATHGLTSGVKAKNAMLIAAVLEELHRDHKPVPELDRACDFIVAYARDHYSGGDVGSTLGASTEPVATI